METARSALQRGAAMLAAAGVDGADGDAKVLMAFVLDVDRAKLSVLMNDPLLPSAVFQFDQVIAMRAQRKPVSHIIGRRDFWAHEFLVTDAVLDPRPDTETLVACALEKPFERVLDMGTGSGAIILSLLAEMPKATGLASDISDAALDVARRNAVRLCLTSRVEFTIADWFDGVTGQFDLIVSNPPYISESEMNDLSPEVFNWEPHLALSPGGDGLAAYRIIADRLAEFMAPSGRVIFEIGHLQAADVIEIFTNAGFVNVISMQDLAGKDRIVVIDANFREKKRQSP